MLKRRTASAGFFSQIWDNKVQESSSDDQIFFNEYLEALKEHPVTLSQNTKPKEIIEKIINSAKLLSSKEVDIKNLLVNLEYTA